MADLAAPALLGLPLTTWLAALGASLLCGFVGTLVVLRRLVALGGGLAHAAFGGIGLAVVVGVDPRIGAAGVALGAAGLLSRLPRDRSDRQDALIGVLWALGMAVGMLLLAGTTGGHVDVEGYLFGDIARVDAAALGIVAAVALLVLAVHLAWGRELVATAFDPDHARLQGLPVDALSFAMMAIVALSVVALLQLVGVVLAIALLAMPPLVALRLFRSLPAIVAGGALVGGGVMIGGLLLGLRLGWPAGPAIVVVGAAVLALSRLAPQRSVRGGAV
jgi:zinc transport system permease protein